MTAPQAQTPETDEVAGNCSRMPQGQAIVVLVELARSLEVRLAEAERERDALRKEGKIHLDNWRATCKGYNELDAQWRSEKIRALAAESEALALRENCARKNELLGMAQLRIASYLRAGWITNAAHIEEAKSWLDLIHQHFRGQP